MRSLALPAGLGRRARPSKPSSQPGLEARDALAPQVQAVVRRIGDLAVLLLTQVLGRAIGLVGRGIAQGMGRSLGRS